MRPSKTIGPWMLAWIATAASAPEPARAQATAAAPCTLSYREAGDAPEGFAAYPSAALGHFPTCSAATPPGTQEIDCGPPRSSPPGPTGHVSHLAGFDFAPPFWLGCGADPPALGGVDGEDEGKSGPGGGANECGSSAVDCVESTPWGPLYGQDECLGDADAGVDGPIEFVACTTTRLRFRATLCELEARPAYLNVLVDWNADGDWNDNLACAATAACAPEWVVKNAIFTVTRGCGEYESPEFVSGPNVGPGWMRVTLSADPVHDGFPWSGSVGSALGLIHSGETEDHPVTIGAAVDAAERGTGSGLELGPAVPSPSRRGCTLRYALTREGTVRAEVLDARGRRVRRLDGLARTPGEHRLAWDGRDDAGRLLPPGVYLVRVESQGEARVQRAIHVR